MTIQQRAAIVLQEIDAALAICEKRLGDENNLRKLASKYDADDALDTAITGVPYSNEVQTDLRDFASFIAASRTLLPASLRCLKTAIKGLLEIISARNLNHDSFSDELEMLTTLLDQWGAGK